MPDAPIKVALSTFPVDRYLVESSEKKELDKIPSEDLWQIEPMMRPEDEAMQRKLQELLQATTEKLEILASDLKNMHQHSTAFKTERTPLDKEFNEKVHIEELVTSKFSNINYINNTKRTSNNSVQPKVKSTKLKTTSTTEIKHRYKTSVRNPSTITNKLSKSGIKIIDIPPNGSKSISSNEQVKKNENTSEYYFKYEPDLASSYSNLFSMHKMPQVNIRSECKKHKIFQIDILPYENGVPQHRANNTIFEIRHDKQAPLFVGANTKATHTEYDVRPKTIQKKSTNGKFTKISARNSSETTISSTEVQNMHILKSIVSQKPYNPKLSPQSPIGIKNKTYSTKASFLKMKEIQKNPMSVNTKNAEKKYPDNTVYLPYSHLTLGGITLADLERAMSEIPVQDMPLSPILDQIINIRELNITQETKAMSASEENLLKDVQDLKHKLTKTFINTENYDKARESEDPKASHVSRNEEQEYYDDVKAVPLSRNEEQEYYDDVKAVPLSRNEEQEYYDDVKAVPLSRNEEQEYYDDVKAVPLSRNEEQEYYDDVKAVPLSRNEEQEYDDDFEDDDVDTSKTESEHTISQPLRKVRILTLRDTIETHEFIPQVTFKDTETQCNSMNKKSLKITQTSPEKISIQPINHVLWPLSTETLSEVNQAFKLEKEIIKKMILEEYGDVINKGTTSASTSTYIHKDINKNTVALQKSIQTSPARVKSVMTSPTKYKTRTTSPVTQNKPIDKETSPRTFTSNQTTRESKSDKELNESVDLAPSLDFSSQKFNLYLPRTSHDAMNNLTINKSYTKTGNFKHIFQYSVKSDNRLHDTSSTTAEMSSSEISSMGEVKRKVYNPFSRKFLSPREIESSESSATSRSSIEQLVKVNPSKSDGEVTQLTSGAYEMIRPGDDDLRSEGQVKG